MDRPVGPGTEVAGGNGSLGGAEPELLAHHVGIGDVPAVVAHGSPDVVLQDLDTTFVRIRAVHQPNCGAMVEKN